MSKFPDNLKPCQPDGTTILAEERSRSCVAVNELSQHLLSRDDFLSRQKRILPFLQRDKIFSKTNQMNLSRPERYHLGLARAKALRRMTLEHGWDHADYMMAEYLVDDVSPYTLHMTMFATTIREQASEEQKSHWWPRIAAWEIIGAYAQTELGHGSNVRGLECQAKWGQKNKEFILHSPTLTASKWWNGTLGRTATHAIVVAQLMLPQGQGEWKSMGPHPFIVQIRDRKTHLPLNGIVVGDIGAKYGYTSMDNAYMLFDNFRIPHSAMLCRYTRVDPETGEYTKPENPAVVYGSLTSVRANIVMHARLVLARAVTVAVRYTSIRRQFRDRDSDYPASPEIAVLDYPTVQIRILPLLATTFALHYSGEAMKELYERSRARIEGGDFGALADLHSTSSGLKSLCTTLAADGIETCRRAMGGHGYGGGSGLVQLNADYLSKPTVEGDNWMITQQVANYLIKKVAAVVKSTAAKPRDSTEKIIMAYLHSRRRSPSELDDVTQNDEAIVKAFERRAAFMSYMAYNSRIVEGKPWNSLLIQLHQLSNAHTELILVKNFHNALTSSALPSDTLTVIRSLFRLFALHTMSKNPLDFLRSGSVHTSILESLPSKIQDMMTEVRPHAVCLMDAWAIPDYLLDSALGRFDGKVYEDLFDRAHRQNPLNKVTFNPDFRSEEIVMGSGKGIDEILAKL